MSVAVTPTIKPLIVLASREITKEEYGLFYEHFNNVIVVNEFTVSKNVCQYTQNDCVVVDMKQEYGRQFWSSNVKYLDLKVDNVVWLKEAGQTVSDYHFLEGVYVCKRIPKKVNSKIEFLHHLLSDVVPMFESRAKGILKKVFGCLFTSPNRP